MRLRLAFALSALPIAVATYLVACSSSQPPEDLCGWLGDEANCYRRLYADIDSTCGKKGKGTARDGSFLKRDKLDICILDDAEGGQIIFDPPLEIDQFPITTASFAMLRGDGTLCGAGAIGPDGAMGIAIASVSIDEGTGIVTPLEDGGLPDSGTTCFNTEQPICGGSFSMKPVTERELIDTKCSIASGDESHRFNREQLAKCDGINLDKQVDTKEEKLAQLFPTAEFESNAGGVNLEGYVLFRVSFPPVNDKDLNGQDPEVIEYFKCRIPSAPSTCANGVQDEGEPETDCGVLCGIGCCADSLCYVNTDCDSNVCAATDGGMGIRRCVGGKTGADAGCPE